MLFLIHRNIFNIINSLNDYLFTEYFNHVFQTIVIVCASEFVQQSTAVEWIEGVFGLSASVPRSGVFGDEKEYDTPQRGNIKTSFVVQEFKSDAWFKRDQTSKKEHGQSFRSIMIENGVHLLPYERTMYTDGCGGNKHVENE